MCACLWGATFPLIKSISYISPPFFMTASRFLCIALMVFFVPRPKVSLSFFISFALLLGCGQYLLSAYSIYSGLSPGTASVLMQIQVFITVIAGVYFLSEKLRIIDLAGIVLGFIGLVTFIYINTNSNNTTVIGIISILVATSSWAAINILLKIKKLTSVLNLVIWASLFNMPILYFISYSLGEFSSLDMNLEELGYFLVAILFLGLLATLYVSVIWGNLIRQFRSALIIPFSIFIPIFGFTFSWIIFEDISNKELMPIILIILGLLLIFKK